MQFVGWIWDFVHFLTERLRKKKLAFVISEASFENLRFLYSGESKHKAIIIS